MRRDVIATDRLTLRPFTSADVPWVHEVSIDPGIQRFTGLPSPYRRRHAEFFVEQVAVAGWDTGRRAEFLAEERGGGARLGRVGLALGGNGLAEIGFWVDPRARGRGVATDSVRAVCRWAFATLDLEIIEWRCEVGNTASRRVAE